MNVFINHTLTVTCGSFTPDGKNIVSASEDKAFILWDPKTATVVTKLTSEESMYSIYIIGAITLVVP